MATDTKTTVIHLRISKEVVKVAGLLAAKADRKIGEYMRRAVESTIRQAARRNGL